MLGLPHNIETCRNWPPARRLCTTTGLFRLEPARPTRKTFYRVNDNRSSTTDRFPQWVTLERLRWTLPTWHSLDPKCQPVRQRSVGLEEKTISTRLDRCEPDWPSRKCACSFDVDDDSALSVRPRVLRNVPRLPGVRYRILRALLAGQGDQPDSGQRWRTEFGRSEAAVHHSDRQLVRASRRLSVARTVGPMLQRLPVVLEQRLSTAERKIQQTRWVSDKVTWAPAGKDKRGITCHPCPRKYKG